MNWLGKLRDFVVPRSTEFLILQPEVGFKDLGGGEEAQDGRIALSNSGIAGLGVNYFGEERSCGAPLLPCPYF